MRQGSLPQTAQDSPQNEKPGAWVGVGSNPPSGPGRGVAGRSTARQGAPKISPPGGGKAVPCNHPARLGTANPLLPQKAFDTGGKILISLQLYKSRGQIQRHHQCFPKPAPCSRSEPWHRDLYHLHSYFEKSKNVKRSPNAVYLHPKHQASSLKGRHGCRLHSQGIICVLRSNLKDICSLAKQ